MTTINKNRSFGVTIKTTKVANGITTITTQTNKPFGLTTTNTIINNQNSIQEPSNLTSQIDQIVTSTNNSINLLANSFNILTGTLNTISTTVSLLSGSTSNSNNSNTIVTLPSSLTSSKSVYYRELTSSINAGEELKFNLADFSTVNFKNNVSVFVNGVRLITDDEVNNPEVFPVSGSKDTVKFNVSVANNSIVTMEVFGSIFI